MNHVEMIRVLKRLRASLKSMLEGLPPVASNKGMIAQTKHEIEGITQAITLLENQRWRKPSEELPTQGKEVLVKFGSGDSFSVAVFCDGEWLIEDEYRHETSDFSQWRYIYEEESE